MERPLSQENATQASVQLKDGVTIICQWELGLCEITDAESQKRQVRIYLGIYLLVKTADY